MIYNSDLLLCIMELYCLSDELRYINYNKMIHLQSEYNKTTEWNIDLFTDDDIDLHIINKYGLMWYYIKYILKLDPLYDINIFKSLDLKDNAREFDFADWKIMIALSKYVELDYSIPFPIDIDNFTNIDTKYKFITFYENTKFSINNYAHKKFGEYMCDKCIDIDEIYINIKNKLKTTKLYNEKDLIGYIYKLFPFIDNIGVALETLIILIHNYKKYDIDEKDIYKLEKICEDIHKIFYSTIYYCYKNFELDDEELINNINSFFSEYDDNFFRMITTIINKDIKTLLKLNVI